MEKIYRLTPSLKDNLWGGNKLREYGKVSDRDRIAESWEISFTPGGEATIEDGRRLSEVFSMADMGTRVEKFGNFPLLTKFIDAREKLSVQVHPSDEYALAREGQFGKTEMWLILEAEEGAGIYLGLDRQTSPEEFRRASEEGTVESLLSFRRVKAGEVYFIPAGTVHAICEGVMIYEIQQNSTLTYRLYDYMRTDGEGRLRELHLDRAMDVSELRPYESVDFDPLHPEVIGQCPYFTASRYTVDGGLELDTDGESFLGITVISGEGSIDGLTARRGDSFLCPAVEARHAVRGSLQIVTVRV